MFVPWGIESGTCTLPILTWWHPFEISPPYIQYHSKVSWQSVVSLDSRLHSPFSIPAWIENRESRIENKLSRIKSRIESHGTENKRFTHDLFLDNFTRTYSCNTTWHGYIRRSDCMLETRPIQVIKQMFLQGHLYQASFPQLKFQIPAPNANKRCNTCVQATSCLFCNVKWFWAYPAAWLDKRSAVTYTSVRK